MFATQIARPFFCLRWYEDQASDFLTDLSNIVEQPQSRFASLSLGPSSQASPEAEEKLVLRFGVLVYKFNVSEGKNPESTNEREINLRGGCQCKLPGLALDELLAATYNLVNRTDDRVERPTFPEDCAIVVAGGQPLLLTTDISPPVGADLHVAGQIAALHAMSDIYAAGGIPKWALATLVLRDDQPISQSQHLLAGIVAQCAREGAEVKGGQTIVGLETLAGLTVAGVPRTGQILAKTGTRQGDVLLISKPVGTGLALRSYALGLADRIVYDTAIAIMTESNRSASEAATDVGVHASTDVSGFGLLGHLSEMLNGSLGAVIRLKQIPLVDGLPNRGFEHLARSVWIENNYEYARHRRTVEAPGDWAHLAAVFDPQTNGGLLVTASPGEATALVSRGFVVIGEINDSGVIRIG